MSTARCVPSVHLMWRLPIHFLCRRQDSENNTILILLAEARPPPSYPQSNGSSEQDFLGATLRMARMYIDRYPDILDWANMEGKTALHVAALKGNEELVRVSLWRSFPFSVDCSHPSQLRRADAL